MKLSFLMVNYNMKGLVEQCVENIAAQVLLTGNDFEVLIADNSTETEFALSPDLAATHTYVSFFRLPRNDGLVSAMNGLFRHVSGEIVFVVHPDIVLEDGCIERLLHFFASHQEAGIISPNMKFPNGDLTMIRISYPSIHSELRRLAGILLYICFKRDFFPKEALWDRASDKDVDMVMSVCLVMRRKVLDAIGEITPELKTYYSNDYLCMRARSLGWKVYYVRDAMVIHYEQFSPDNLYSVSNEMAYKKSAVPISYLLERDKFTFMKHLRSKTGLAVLKCITTIEYVVHALASIKKFRQISTPASRAYLSVIKEIWSV